MAHASKKVNIEELPKYQISKPAKTMIAILMFIGVLTFIFGLYQESERIWHSYIVSYFYFISLSLGGLFFCAINHVSNAYWSVTVRRIAEAFTSFLPIGLIATLILLLGIKDLFMWLDADTVAKDAILQGKEAYLNKGFFLIRIFGFLGLWIWFGMKIVKNSLDQDKDGNIEWTRKNVFYSVIFLVVFAFSYSLFSVDMMMSLDPHWFSTMFGVYCFAGLFQSFLAMAALFAIYFVKHGYLSDYVNENHIHDIGKFLWAFTIFYAYIAFSQFMLIWYANIPEETLFFIHRGHGAWMWVSMSLLFVKFVFPFLALAPRGAKRNYQWLSMVAVVILIMQYVDLYWLVYPNFDAHHVKFSFWEIGVFLGFLGAFLLAANKFLEKHNIVAIRDPRLQKSLDHHQ